MAKIFNLLWLLPLIGLMLAAVIISITLDGCVVSACPGRPVMHRGEPTWEGPSDDGSGVGTL